MATSYIDQKFTENKFFRKTEVVHACFVCHCNKIVAQNLGEFCVKSSISFWMNFAARKAWYIFYLATFLIDNMTNFGQIQPTMTSQKTRKFLYRVV